MNPLILTQSEVSLENILHCTSARPGIDEEVKTQTRGQRRATLAPKPIETA